MVENDTIEELPQQVVCPNCLEENEPFQHFCAKCGAPLSPISTIGPLERTFPDGFMYRQAVAGQRKLIVVIGIWVIFLPAFAVSVSFLVMFLIDYFDGFLQPVGLAISMFALGLCSFIILFRTTKNHLIIRRKALEQEENEAKKDVSR